MKFGACKHRFLSVLLALLLALTPIQAVAEAAAQSAKTTDVSLSSEISAESLDLDFSTVVLDQVGAPVAVKMNNGSTTWTPGASGGSKTISFTNASYNISVDYSSGTSSWATGTVGGTQGTVTVKKNTSYSSRSGDVIFLDTQKGGEYKVHIVQSGAPKPTATNTNTPTPTKTPTPKPRLSVDKTSLTFTNGASTQSVKLSNIVGSISVDYGSNTSSWVTAGVGGSTGTISVKANTSYSKRTGTVVYIDNGTGYSVTITVTQNAAPTPTPTKTPTPTPKPPTNTPTPIPKLKADKTSLTFSNGASSQTVKLSNIKGTISVDYGGNTSSWVTATFGGSTGTISVKANTTYSKRSGTVVFLDNGTGYSVTITVTQNAAPTPTPTPTNTPTPIVKITSNKTALTFSNGASSQTVKLSNVKGNVTVDYGANTSSWVTASVGGTTGTISVKANTSYSKRTGTVVFVDNGTGYSVSISITQSGAPTPTPTPKPKLAISKTSLTVGNGTSGQSLTISNAVGQLEVDYDGNTSSWVTAGVGGSTLTITVKANTTYTKRTGRVIVIDRATGQSVSVTITQNAAPTPTPKPKLAADKTSFTVSNSGATLSVKLSNVTGPLSVDYGGNTGSWATASVGGNTGTIIVKANKNYSKRSGTVIFIDNGTGSSVTVTITQNAAPTPTPTNTPTPRPKMSSTVTEVTFSYGASSRSVPLRNVVGQVTVDYDDGNTASWITAGCGGSTGTISVKANTGYTERTGKVVFIDNSTGDSVIVTVKQSGAPKPTATPSPTPKLGSDKQELTFTHQSGTQKVTLTNVSGQITVDYSGNTQSWVTAAFGGNTGTISVKANTSYSQRTGQVVFVDHGNGQHVIVNVTQNGAPKPTPVPKLTVNKGTLYFQYTASEQKVTIGNVVGQIDVDYGPNTSSWVLGSFGGNTGTISVKANTKQEARTGQVVFIDRSTGQSIIVVVEQEAGPVPTPTNSPTPTLKLKASQEELLFSETASSRRISFENVLGELSYEYENIGDMSWLNCSGGGTYFTISVKDNLKRSNRIGRIAFIDHKSGQSVLVTVKQRALFDDSLATDPAFLTFSYEAGTQKVQLLNVNGNITIEYSAGAEEWISAAGGGTSYSITVKENITFKDRTGKVVFIDNKTGQSAIVDIEQKHKAEWGPFPVTFVINKYRSTVVNQTPYREYKLPDMIDNVPIEDVWPQHTFLGWYTQEHGGVLVKATDKVTSYRDTLYAHWQSADAIEVHCYFNYKPVAVEYQVMYAERGGVYEKLPPAGERYGYTFAGWYTKPEGGEYIREGMEVRDTLTRLYAHWTPKKVKVDFVNLEEYNETVKGSTRIYVDFGLPIGDVFPKVVNSNGHRISGWIDRKGNHYTPSTVISTVDDIELVALWNGADEYTVYFDGNGNYFAHTMEPCTFQYGGECILPVATFDGGDGFVCWGTAPDGSGHRYDANTVYGDLVDRQTGSIVLYAMWNEYYNITYYDGVTKRPILQESMPHVFSIYGDKEFPELKVSGLKFKGWKDASNYIGLLDDEIEYGPYSNYVNKGDRHLNLYPIYDVVETGKRALIFYDPEGHFKTFTYYVSKETEAVLMPKVTEHDDHHEFSYWVNQKTVEVGGPQEVDNTWKAGEKLDFGYIGTFVEEDYAVFQAVWKHVVEKVTLVYGYDDLKEEITIEEDGYKLPKPERKGYTFCGWGLDTETVSFLGDEEYHSSKSGTTLYAIWEPISVTVVYYNSFTGAVIDSQEVTTLDKVAANTVNVSGMTFYGWTDIKPEADNANDLRWTFSRLDRKQFYQPNDLVMTLPYDEGTVELYGCFVLEGIDDEGTTLIYLPNKGKATPSSGYFKFGDTLKIADDPMERTGCSFTGWKLLDETITKKTFPYKPGEEFFLGAGILVLFFEAQWTSDFKLELKTGHDLIPAKDISDRYLPGDVILTKDLNVEEWPGHYIKGWKTSEGEFFGCNDSIDVPFCDMTIEPVWEETEFYIYYHSGFNAELCVAFPAESTTNLTFSSSKIEWLNVPGYIFLGWSEIDPRGAAWLVNPDNIILPWKNVKRTLTGDLHVYACYQEQPAPTDGTVMVVYNPLGGTGGPTIEYYDPRKEDYYISDQVPEREGYDFRGWAIYDIACVDYTANKKYTGDYEEHVVRLYAVWEPKVYNYKKIELQTRYGKELMPDYYFDEEYSSSRWQKINDRCYFVIKTTNVSESDKRKIMSSEALVVEYAYGTWYLYGDAAGYSIRHQVEYDILTHNNNFKGRILKAFSDVGFFVASKIPGAGTMLKVLDIGGALLDFASSLEKSDGAEFAKKVASEMCTAIYNQLIKEGHDATYADSVCKTLLPELIKWSIKGISLEKNDMISIVKDLGKAVITNAKNLDSDAIETKFVQFGNRFNEQLVKIAGENAYQLHLEEIDIAGLLKKIPYDFLGCVWSIAWDQVKYSINSKNLDPFGDFDLALQTYQKEITKHGFSQDIADAFPGVINDIFLDYYIQ